VSELFHSIDLEHRASVDFRSFIVSLCVLRSGSFDQRLWFAFRAYDQNGNEALEQGEVYQLLKSAHEAKNNPITEQQIWSQINNAFRIYDYGNTGRLTFE
jgi:Ca2+-binding EF-hand superfamily protein